MRRSAFFAALTLSAPILGSQPCAAQTAALSEVRIPNTRQIEFVSSANGRAYAIRIGLPDRPPPPTGYRTLYVLDGDLYFASAVEAVRANGNAPDVIVVGIGYPDPAAAAKMGARTYDLTLPADDGTLAAWRAPGQAVRRTKDVGGVDDFLRMIEVDVKPRVAAVAPVDATQQTLFGHSLGGLAVLRALFTHPGDYRSFVAASPAIWWADRAVLAEEATFSRKVKAGIAAPRILITVGALEETVPVSIPAGASREDYAAMAARARLIGNARDLVARLKTVKSAGTGYQIADLAVLPGVRHGTAPWPAIALAIAYSF